MLDRSLACGAFRVFDFGARERMLVPVPEHVLCCLLTAGRAGVVFSRRRPRRCRGSAISRHHSADTSTVPGGHRRAVSWLESGVCVCMCVCVCVCVWLCVSFVCARAKAYWQMLSCVDVYASTLTIWVPSMPLLSHQDFLATSCSVAVASGTGPEVDVDVVLPSAAVTTVFQSIVGGTCGCCVNTLM